MRHFEKQKEESRQKRCDFHRTTTIKALLATLALLFAFPTVSVFANSEEEDLYDEVERGQWESLGKGKLIDGWLTEGTEIDVEIQRNIENKKRFRVWMPYGAMQGENASIYCGQIVFDVTDPFNVKLEYGKAAGVLHPGMEGAEMYIFNDYGLYNGTKMLDSPTLFDGKQVLIPNARYIYRIISKPENGESEEDDVIGEDDQDAESSTESDENNETVIEEMVSTGRSATIIMPESFDYGSNPLVENSEYEYGKWESIGIGRLLDGWNTKSEFDVEIQRDVNKLGRFRIWRPYKYYKQLTGKDNNSANLGQIVFDTSNPSDVSIERKLAGILMPGLTTSTLEEATFLSEGSTAGITFNGTVVNIPTAQYTIPSMIYSRGVSQARITFPEGYDLGYNPLEIWERDANNWAYVGMGKLEDGWLTDGETFDVEIHKSKLYPNRYRVWEPYKTLRERDGNRSEYLGQIVFDITVPDYVHLVLDKPAGYFHEKNDAHDNEGDIYILNHFGYLYNKYNGDRFDVTDDSPGTFGEYLREEVDMDPRRKSVYYEEENKVVIDNATYFIKGFSSFHYTGRPSTITLPSKEEQDKAIEEERGNWTSIGMGRLIDGWVTDGEEFDVEIQQNNVNPNLYRIWEPYKSIEDNASKYRGQIVFDISDPDYVNIKWNSPAGYFHPTNEDEVYALNFFGYRYKNYNGDKYAGSQLESILTTIRDDIDNVFNPGYGDGRCTTTYKDFTVTVNNSLYALSTGKPMFTERPTKIILPHEPTEEEQMELEEGQWEDYGMGQLIDAWVTDGKTFDVEIQRDVNNHNRYRIWRPYKNLKKYAGFTNDSQHLGQIVFEIKDKENVLLEFSKPAGYFYDGKYSGEMYILNEWASKYEDMKKMFESMGMPVDREAILNGTKQTTQNKSYVDGDGAIVIPAAMHTNAIYSSTVNTDKTAKIIMPEQPGEWEIVCEQDYFDFEFNGTKIDVSYDNETGSYRLPLVKDQVLLEATLKPEYGSHLIASVIPDHAGGEITTSENMRGFSFTKRAFAGEYKFDVTVNEVMTSWEIVTTDDFLKFSLNGKSAQAPYNEDTHSYKFVNIAQTDELTGTLVDSYEDYAIASLNATIDKNSANVTKPMSLEPTGNSAGSIAPDGKSFSIKMSDYIGTYKFNVELGYIGPLVKDVVDPIITTTHSSASILLKYDSSLIPEHSTILVYYGPSDVPVEQYNDFTQGTANSVTIKTTGLEAETDYEYTIVIKVLNEDGEDISPVRQLNVKFRTKAAPVKDENISADAYMWDTTTIPENKYTVCTFFSYYTTVDAVPAEFKPSISSVLGSYFKKNNDAGVRELTLHFAHLLPNPPQEQETDIPFSRGKWFIIKNPTGDTGKEETLYMPNVEGQIGEDGVYVPAQVKLENGVRHDGFKSTKMKLNDKSTSWGDRRWGMDLLDYFAFETYGTKDKIYNVIIVLGFDVDDIAYEKPTYMKVTYELEPQTCLIGTIAQTSTDFDPDMDNTGGWHTWVPLTPTGDDENPYPYVYDFIAQEPEYDLSFTFDNKRLLDELASGRNSVYKQFELQEIYPHNMAWYANFEAPDNWRAEPLSREVRNNCANYYPGYIGPYISTIRPDSQGEHAPSFVNSIKLTDLKPGHHYQLVIDHPSYGWETDYNNRDVEFTYICNALGYISLIDYEVEDGSVNAYQLVQDTQEEGTYYTYDFKSTGKTYKVILDADDQVNAYSEVTTINEAEDYKDPRYLFTDKIFVFAEGYGNQEIDDKKNNIVVKILEERAEIVMTETDDRRLVEGPNGVTFGRVYTMTGLDNPLDAKKFDIRKHTLTYQRGYTTCANNRLELFVTDRPVTHRMPWQYDNNIPKSPRLYDPETYKFDDVTTEGVLTVPTPMPDPAGVQYSLTTPTNASTAPGDAGNTVFVRIYADDVREEGDEFVEYAYELPSQKLHSHYYDIAFPYFSSNVTSDLGSIMNEPSQSKDHNIRFSFFSKGPDNRNYVSAPVDPNNYSTPGFFNAHMGDIFEKVINQGEPSDERSLQLSYEPADFPARQIYDRWGKGETAKVTLNLAAPGVYVPAADEDYNGPVHLHRIIRQQGDDPDVWIEAVQISGAELTNTPDKINSTDELVTGDVESGFTTLYLLEIPNDPYDWSKGISQRRLITKEEMPLINFDVATSTQTFPFDNWPGWNGENFYIDYDDIKDVEPFRIRNVYLFPVANHGLLNDDKTETPADNADGAAGDAPLAIANVPDNLPSQGKEDAVVYHGVTTPPETVKISVLKQDIVTTGVTDVTTEATTLARVESGTVNILVEDAELYGTTGTLMAKGIGRHAVNPGFYVVIKGRAFQKLVVR